MKVREGLIPAAKNKNYPRTVLGQFLFLAAGPGLEPGFNAPGAFGLPLADPAIFKNLYLNS